MAKPETPGSGVRVHGDACVRRVFAAGSIPRPGSLR